MASIRFITRVAIPTKLEPANPGFMDGLMRPEVSDEKWLKDSKETELRVAFANWITDEKEGAGSLLKR